MRFKFILLLSLVFATACDNTLVSPQFESYKAPEDIIDSTYLKLKVKYAGNPTEDRTLIVKSTTSSYDLFDYTHTINFTDGSKMVVITTYNFYLNTSFNSKTGNNVSGWQGNYAAMTFIDKYKNSTYEFRAKTAALTTGSSYYKGKYHLVTFNDIYCGDPGYVNTKCSLNGTLAILKY